MGNTLKNGAAVKLCFKNSYLAQVILLYNIHTTRVLRVSDNIPENPLILKILILTINTARLLFSTHNSYNND